MTIKHTGILGALLLIVVVVLVVIFNLPEDPKEEVPEIPEPVVEVPEEPKPTMNVREIGTSVQKRAIEVVEFGGGEETLLFVGGVHGGYEWNSVLLAYEMIDHLRANPDLVPDNLTIAIIPSLNPDGVFEVLGTVGRFTLSDVASPGERIAEGRFNANGVDLNRNFDCKWAPESSWRGETVSAGTGPFSEPEAVALRDYVLEKQPKAVVFWHSQANNVYASECENGVLPETLILMETYADAADYGKVPVFDAYPITGDAEGWLASLGIPAVTVELETYSTIEWPRNLAGTLATIDLYKADSVAR